MISNLERFQHRIQALPSHAFLHPGYVVVEEKPGQYLFHSGSQSFEIRLPVPGFPLTNFLKQLAEQQSLESLLGSLSLFQVVFLLDVLETLHKAGLLISASASEDGASSRYTQQAFLFNHLRQTGSEGVSNFLRGNDWQAQLSSAHVGLIGLGRVGSQLARLLAIAGVGHLTGLDGDLVNEPLRYTDAWYEEADRGNPRTRALARRLNAVNPDLSFTPLEIPLAELDQDSFPPQLLGQDLLVVATDHLVPNLYELVNQVCVETSLPWTSYRTSWTGLAVEIGPTVYPKETACYACYQVRRHQNLAQPEWEGVLAGALGTQSLPLLDLQITPCVALLSYEILRFLSGQVFPVTANAILEFNLVKAELIRRPLLKVPRCPVCRRNIQPFAPVQFWADLYDETHLSPLDVLPGATHSEAVSPLETENKNGKTVEAWSKHHG
jgi:bacteriocin biosynthesis cyclodehydratase domain-containing protein